MTESVVFNSCALSLLQETQKHRSKKVDVTLGTFQPSVRNVQYFIKLFCSAPLLSLFIICFFWFVFRRRNLRTFASCGVFNQPLRFFLHNLQLLLQDIQASVDIRWAAVSHDLSWNVFEGRYNSNGLAVESSVEQKPVSGGQSNVICRMQHSTAVSVTECYTNIKRPASLATQSAIRSSRALICQGTRTGTSLGLPDPDLHSYQSTTSASQCPGSPSQVMLLPEICRLDTAR